jgi:hypothetical protein
MPQNSNKNFLKNIMNIIDQIDIHYNNDLKYLSTSQYTQIKNKFKSEIKELIDIISMDKKSYEDNNLEVMQKCFDNIKEKYKKYNEFILEIYENNFIKKIKEEKEKLNDLINKIIIDFDPKKANSFSSDVNINFITYYESSKTEESISKAFYGEESNKTQNNVNTSQSIENNFICTICHEGKAINLCEECNQLFCQICEKNEKSEEKKTIKCRHYPQKIDNIKNSNVIEKVLYLNSLNNFIKRIILKSDYLLKNGNEDIKLNNDSDNNSSKYIKKSLFEYPNMNIKDDLTEKNYYNCINEILENNLGKKNLNIKNFNISEIDQRLVRLLKSISREEKEDKQYQINSLSTCDSRYLSGDEEDDDDIDDVENETFVKK